MKDTTPVVLTAETLHALATRQGEPCVSIYLAAHQPGTPPTERPIRLKNMLREAEQELSGGGMRPADARKLLAPAEALINSEKFWITEPKPLALLLTAATSARIFLERPTADVLVISDHFHTRPLVLELAHDETTAVLAVSKNRVRVLQVSRHGAAPLRLKGMPASLDDFRKLEEADRDNKFRKEGSRPGKASTAFSAGGGEDPETEAMTRYLRQIAQVVADALPERSPTLIWAGVDEAHAIYQGFHAAPRLLPEPILGNPDRTADHELAARARDILMRERLREVEQLQATLAERIGTENSATTLPEVLAAARDGRIDTLLVDESVHCWGHFEPSDASLEVHATRQAGDADLLDTAVSGTLRTRGRILPVPSGTLPGEAGVVALLRY